MNKLKSKYDPSIYQYQDKYGKVFEINELSRDDLMQVVCECMEAIEKAEKICLKQLDVFDSWRRGRFNKDD